MFAEILEVFGGTLSALRKIRGEVLERGTFPDGRLRDCERLIEGAAVIGLVRAGVREGDLTELIASQMEVVENIRPTLKDETWAVTLGLNSAHSLGSTIYSFAGSNDPMGYLYKNNRLNERPGQSSVFVTPMSTGPILLRAVQLASNDRTPVLLGAVDTLSMVDLMHNSRPERRAVFPERELFSQEKFEPSGRKVFVVDDIRVSGTVADGAKQGIMKKFGLEWNDFGW